jgi:hypothetical protein
MLEDLLLGNYKLVSERLGLTIDGGFTANRLRIYGIVDGIPMQMWFGAHSTHTSAQLLAPAPIELGIVTTTLFDKVKGFFGADHAALGDPAFDAVFSVKAADLAELGRMLSADARLTLLQMAAEGLHPAVDRNTVHLRRFSNGGTDDPAVIERDFHETARLVRVLASALV